MNKQIVIHILNADIKKVKRAITHSLNKSINTKDLANKMEKAHKALSNIFGESNNTMTTDELVQALNMLNEKKEGFPKCIEDFVIVDNNGVCSIYSDLFTIDNISQITEQLFRETKFDLVFIASIDNNVFVTDLYEKGSTNGQLVVGQFNDLWCNNGNLFLDYFEEKFNIEKGTFNAIVSKADVQYAKAKFAELTNLSVDFPINQSGDGSTNQHQSGDGSVIDPDKH
ncbi:MAG: hypothetical protein IJA02_10720 [Clostridia bacterium]|nr:hypothetical protein [Clostridia bacterium]